MNFSFLSPVSATVIAHNEMLSQQSLGKKVKIHTAHKGIPNLDDVQLAIIGVKENRNDVNYIGGVLDFDTIRTSFYSLYAGNWHTSLADLGNISPGETIEDTYFALRTAVELLVEKKIIPIILGGSQDLTYAVYRAYDNLQPMVNLVSVDTHFDLGDTADPLKNNSYVGKIILEEPYNLFNYSTVGYQTYFNSQEEIDLMERLYFESHRLGDISQDITIVEPVMRDAHIVSVDLKSVRAAELGGSLKFSPNGLDGKEICAISRYAGISNKVSCFGVYEYQYAPKDSITPMLIAQVLWYFVEGVNYRVNDDDFTNLNTVQKYTVLIENQELVFYRSTTSNRWWVEIPFLTEFNNKLKKHTLLPCMHKDYLDATTGKLPSRWFKAYKKNNF